MTPTAIAKSLLTAGFSVPLNHPLVTADGSIKDPLQEGFDVIHTGGGCMSLYREYGRFYMQISMDSGDGFDLDDWKNNLIGVYDLKTDDEFACVSAEVWQEVITAATALHGDHGDGWIDFTHNGKRWSFDGDHLAIWDDVDGHFEFLKFHRLAEPTVESVSRFIDQL